MLGTQKEAAREVQMEIERRKNEALQGFKSATGRLLVPHVGGLVSPHVHNLLSE
ncbi:hypothetical protein RND71_042901 [Anisodus tanguticus]|uniref:Uncharacterized protein n=1 Tax=Anisodus tanguticus TaxID=243964 RepID=A0AAE1QR44_9SOLA|nr:hypothetical protein RND71_042901 [Anisodus tanguticus]